MRRHLISAPLITCCQFGVDHHQLCPDHFYALRLKGLVDRLARSNPSHVSDLIVEAKLLLAKIDHEQKEPDAG